MLIERSLPHLTAEADLCACVEINVALGLFVRELPDYALIVNRLLRAAASTSTSIPPLIHTSALQSFSAVKREH